MKKCFLIILFAVFFATLSAHHDGWGKLTGVARRALMDESRRAVVSQARGTTPEQERRLTAFLRVSAVDAHEVLERHRCTKLAQAGDICIVSVPLCSLESLAGEPSVVRIEASAPASVTMDTTRLIVNAMPAYEPTVRHQAYTGAGVVVGLVDVGFDMTHPTFFNAAGNQFRVGAFWDQLSRDTVGSNLPVGCDYVGYEAVLAQQHSVDAKTQSHGNHTTGIAAGGGYTTPYRGMAYESDLCLVSNAVSSDIEYVDSADYYKYTSATDALGFKYLFDYADSKGKPCVVSFSEGYTPYLDEEDSLYAAFIDSLVSVPGHVFVASAGNEGLLKTYIEKPAGLNQVGAFILSSEKEAACKIKANGPLDIFLHFYDRATGKADTTLAVSSADSRLDSLLVDSLLWDNDTCIVRIERYPSSFGKDDFFYFVALSASSKRLSEIPLLALAVAATDTHVEVYGNSKLSFTDSAVDERWNAAAYGHNILAPGCFAAAICVGSTSHRSNVMNYKGVYKTVGPSAGDGLYSKFSSSGPSMNGLTKPDVTAPGLNIVSSYSRYYLDQHPAEDENIVAFSDFQKADHPWVVSSGTSMSAPVVAGAIALWLQANPRLTQQDVKGVISRTCRRPDSRYSYPNYAYGYGEIDVYRGLLDVLQLDAVDGLSQQSTIVQISPQETGLRLSFDELPTGQLTLKIYHLNGNCVCTTSVHPTSHEVLVSLPQKFNGIYAVQLDGTDRKICGSQLVRF